MHERIFLKESRTLAIIIGESFYEHENTRTLVCEVKSKPHFMPVIQPYSIISDGELWMCGDTVITKDCKAKVEDITYNELSNQVVLHLRISEAGKKDRYKLVTEDQVKLVNEDLSGFIKSGSIVYNRKLASIGIIEHVVIGSWHRVMKVKDIMEVNTHKRPDPTYEEWDEEDLIIYTIQDAIMAGYINFV